MKVLFVYDSAFGNTQEISELMGKALAAKAETKVLRSDKVKPDHLASIELLIVGSPTQRSNPTASVKQFLEGLTPGGLDDNSGAAFDTRFMEDEISKTKVLEFFVNIFGYAAEPISRKLVKKGGTLISPPERFYVRGMEGLLLDGEVERPSTWAETVREKS